MNCKSESWKPLEMRACNGNESNVDKSERQERETRARDKSDGGI